MATSLRIEVESAGVNAPPVDSSAPKTFNQLKAEREAAAEKFREDAARMRKETGVGGTVTERQERQRIRDEERQNRDENWLARQEAKAQRQQEMAEKRADRLRQQAEERQNRDEEWVARREAMDQRKREQQAQRQQREQEARDPKKIAQNILNSERLREAAREEYKKLAPGHGALHNIGSDIIQLMGQRIVSRMAGVSAIAAPVRTIVSKVTEFASALPAVVKGFGLVAVAAAGVTTAWNKMTQALIDEAHRVKNFSPALRIQEIRNEMRSLRTDIEIAQKYGGRMAKLEDFESRQSDALRRIGVNIAASLDEFFSPVTDFLQETYTSILEWMADSGKHTAKSSEYLQKLSGMSEAQLEAMVSRRDRELLEEVAKGADSILKVIGSNGMFNQSDDVTDIFSEEKSKDIGFDVWKPNAANPGFVPVPQFWRSQES